MNVAIIGCGLIGGKRVHALGEHRLVIAADPLIERAQRIVSISKYPALAVTDWHEAVQHPDVDVVIIATSNDQLTPAALSAVEHNKHVLVEKPAARSAAELKPLCDCARKKNKKVKVGFNLRYHPALRKAKMMIEAGDIGPLMFIRGRYGHGGRIGYDKEWRANPEISGGGELIDQGVHVIDLTRWFLGDITHIDSFAHTYFWNMPVDDNAFLALRTPQDQMAWLHVSCSEWKNMFCFEIYGKNGKLQIDGLGGSYGVERLTYYKMHEKMGPPDTTLWEYPGEDCSWKDEWNDFMHALENNTPLNGDAEDAYHVLRIVATIYQHNKGVKHYE